MNPLAMASMGMRRKRSLAINVLPAALTHAKRQRSQLLTQHLWMSWKLPLCQNLIRMGKANAQPVMEMIPGKPLNVVVVADDDVVELREHDLKVAVAPQPPEHRAVVGDVEVGDGVEVTDVVVVMDVGIAVGVVVHVVVDRFSSVVK
jgi:hypothetical protein